MKKVVLLVMVLSTSVVLAKEVCCHEYQSAFRAKLPVAFSIDPEVRGNMINESLPYIAGETADILRVLLLIKETDPSLKEELMKQIGSSENREVACKVLADLGNMSEERKSEFNNYIEYIIKSKEKSDISDDVVKGQPTAYCGPMNSFHLGDLSDKSKRSELYQEMKQYDQTSRIYLSALFLLIETDNKLILELREMQKQTEEGSFPKIAQKRGLHIERLIGQREEGSARNGTNLSGSTILEFV